MPQDDSQGILDLVSQAGGGQAKPVEMASFGTFPIQANRQVAVSDAQPPGEHRREDGNGGEAQVSSLSFDVVFQHPSAMVFGDPDDHGIAPSLPRGQLDDEGAPDQKLAIDESLAPCALNGKRLRGSGRGCNSTVLPRQDDEFKRLRGTGDALEGGLNPVTTQGFESTDVDMESLLEDLWKLQASFEFDFSEMPFVGMKPEQEPQHAKDRCENGRTIAAKEALSLARSLRPSLQDDRAPCHEGFVSTLGSSLAKALPVARVSRNAGAMLNLRSKSLIIPGVWLGSAGVSRFPKRKSRSCMRLRNGALKKIACAVGDVHDVTHGSEGARGHVPGKIVVGRERQCLRADGVDVVEVLFHLGRRMGHHLAHLRQVPDVLEQIEEGKGLLFDAHAFVGMGKRNLVVNEGEPCMPGICLEGERRGQGEEEQRHGRNERTSYRVNASCHFKVQIAGMELLRQSEDRLGPRPETRRRPASAESRGGHPLRSRPDRLHHSQHHRRIDDQVASRGRGGSERTQIKI